MAVVAGAAARARRVFRVRRGFAPKLRVALQTGVVSVFACRHLMRVCPFGFGPGILRGGVHRVARKTGHRALRLRSARVARRLHEAVVLTTGNTDHPVRPEQRLEEFGILGQTPSHHRLVRVRAAGEDARARDVVAGPVSRPMFVVDLALGVVEQPDAMALAAHLRGRLGVQHGGLDRGGIAPAGQMRPVAPHEILIHARVAVARTVARFARDPEFCNRRVGPFPVR